jgi:acrylyl-CoA reductase (NADPH)
MPRRVAAWESLARTLDRRQLAGITKEIGLKDAVGAASELLAGQVRGRLVVNVNA